MAAQVSEGRTNVYWATAVANKAAPTVAEITAAVALTTFITKDGVRTPVATNNVDSAMIDSAYDSQVVGSWGSEVELRMKRDSTADTAWNLCVYGTAGFLIIDRFRASGTLPSAGMKVEVWPAQMHQPAVEPPAANTLVTFIEKFAITSEPKLNATVA
jgi:hypothetical protein